MTYYSKMDRQALLGALAALTLGATSACEKPPSEEATESPSQTVASAKASDKPTVTAPSASVAKEAKDCCMGLNDCRGKGGCAVPESHDCRGKNACKGRGGCNAHCPM
jgi:hypothetical protein